MAKSGPKILYAHISHFGADVFQSILGGLGLLSLFLPS